MVSVKESGPPLLPALRQPVQCLQDVRLRLLGRGVPVPQQGVDLAGPDPLQQHGQGLPVEGGGRVRSGQVRRGGLFLRDELPRLLLYPVPDGLGHLLVIDDDGPIRADVGHRPKIMVHLLQPVPDSEPVAQVAQAQVVLLFRRLLLLGVQVAARVNQRPDVSDQLLVGHLAPAVALSVLDPHPGGHAGDIALFSIRQGTRTTELLEIVDRTQVVGQLSVALTALKCFDNARLTLRVVPILQQQRVDVLLGDAGGAVPRVLLPLNGPAAQQPLQGELPVRAHRRLGGGGRVVKTSLGGLQRGGLPGLSPGGVLLPFLRGEVAPGLHQGPKLLLHGGPGQQHVGIQVVEAVDRDADAPTVIPDVAGGPVREGKIAAAGLVLVPQETHVVLGGMGLGKPLLDAELAVLVGAAQAQHPVDLLLGQSKSGGFFILRRCNLFHLFRLGRE